MDAGAYIHRVSKKLCHFYFLNNSVKHLPILIMAHKITKKLDKNDCSFGHLTLILSLHYLAKFTSRSLAVYNNEFILDSACVGSEIIN